MTSNYRYTRASVRNPRAQRAFAREATALVPLTFHIRRASSVANRQAVQAAALMARPEFVDLMSNVLSRMHLENIQAPMIQPVPLLSEEEHNAFMALVYGAEDIEPVRVAPGAPLRPPADPRTPPRGGRRLVFESPQQDPPSSPQYEPVSPQSTPSTPAYCDPSYSPTPPGEEEPIDLSGEGVEGVEEPAFYTLADGSKIMMVDLSGVEEPQPHPLFTDITDGSKIFPIDLSREGVEEGTKECPIVL